MTQANKIFELTTRAMKVYSLLDRLDEKIKVLEQYRKMDIPFEQLQFEAREDIIEAEKLQQRLKYHIQKILYELNENIQNQ